jgi:hypothetical protein
MRLPIIFLLSASGVLMFSDTSPAQELPGAQDKIDCLLIERAQIKLPKKTAGGLPKLEYANYGHEVVWGKGYVFAVRRFSDDGSGPDSAIFEKITLGISDVKIELNTIKTRLNIIRGYYSRGGVGFVSRGDYWRSTNPNPIPQIEIFKTADGLSARVSASVHVTFVSSKEYKDVRVEISCPVRTVKVSELGPWEGKSGTSWNSFAPAHPLKNSP